MRGCMLNFVDGNHTLTFEVDGSEYRVSLSYKDEELGFLLNTEQLHELYNWIEAQLEHAYSG